MSLEGLKLGRYQLLKALGSGGMGEVYQAEDTHIHRHVAIKIVRSETTPYPNTESARESERLFRREVRAIATLDHPHILPLFDYGEETQQSITYTFMVMPLRLEGSLTQWLRQHNNAAPLSPQEAAQIILQAARALQYAHQHQIIHQDVKPSNFLVRQSDEHPNLPDLQLADFGIAKFHTATASMSQTSRGTPSYMAPEQWSGHPVPATDQYALAIMAYQLLTGVLPFQGRQEQVMYQHFNVTPPSPSQSRPLLPPEADKVILQALAKKPAERFPSILDFAHALQRSFQNSQVEQPAAPTITSVKSGMLATPISSPLTPSTSQELRATLAISTSEAQSGTTRTLTLPGGKKIQVQVPAQVADGHIIYLAGEGSDAPLAVTIAIKHAEEEQASRIAVGSESAMTHMARPSQPIPVPPTQAVQRAKPNLLQQQTLTISRKSVLIGLAILVVIGSLGTFYFTRFNYLQRMSLLSEAIPNLYPPHTGTLALNDSLRDNSNGYAWYEGSKANINCSFSEAAYHVSISQQNADNVCNPDNTNFTNFAYEIQMTFIKGDGGGIVFREDYTTENFYYFYFGQNGSYQLTRYSSNSDQTLSHGTISNVIHTGIGQMNVLAVVADGSTITLYINQQSIASVTDTTYSQGQIGVAAEEINNPTEVAFTNARVWAF
jgi:serine/threonine protein kinase